MRRDRGTWYTPAELVERTLDEALARRVARTGSVCDPACGSGNFLVAAARRMRAAGRDPSEVARAIAGADLDPRAVALARIRLRLAVGGTRAAWRRSVRCTDSLRPETWCGTDDGAPRKFDAVVGNPPFLSPARRRTARSPGKARVLRERFHGVVSGNADTACGFLLLASELCAKGGRVVMVMPMSLLATADAAPTRMTVAERCSLRGCLVPPVHCFGGGVPTVVLVLERAPCRGRSVRVARILDDRAGAAVSVPAERIAGGAWGALGAALAGVPYVPEVAGRADACGALRDIATGTADFRQHFYGLKGRVQDGPLGATRRAGASASGCALPATTARKAAVVTVGSVDAARCLWGVRPIRLHRRAYIAPLADLRALGRMPELAPWTAERLVPKVLVATQTRAIEAWADAAGRALPCTPLVSIMPRDRADLWRVAAVLLSPPVAAVAWWRHAGAARSSSALKLSARQVLALPLPPHEAPWRRGAMLVRAWHARPLDAARRRAFAEAMCAAYGVRGAASGALVGWWTALVHPRSAEGPDAPRVLLNSPLSTR
jgi:tRNA1(Val) A37 N6-methylase TrmN6